MSDTEPVPTYASVNERDMDLALCLSAPAVPNVWKLFHDTDHAPEVFHSISHGDGEVDVTLQWPDLTVHVENKVDAVFQPEQSERYARRADTATVPTTTALFAPERYIENHSAEAANFNQTVSYQAFREVMRNEPGSLAERFVDLIDHAIEQNRRGRDKIVSDARTAFFADFAELSARHGLPWRHGPDRGASSGFFNVHNWDVVAGHKVELVAKFGRNHRAVDIQISKAGHLIDRLAGHLGHAELTARKTPNDTLIVHREAPFLDPDQPLTKQLDDAEQFMNDSIALVTWWQQTGKRHLSTVFAEANHPQPDNQDPPQPIQPN